MAIITWKVKFFCPLPLVSHGTSHFQEKSYPRKIYLKENLVFFSYSWNQSALVGTKIGMIATLFTNYLMVVFNVNFLVLHIQLFTIPDFVFAKNQKIGNLFVNNLCPLNLYESLKWIDSDGIPELFLYAIEFLQRIFFFLS